MSVAIDRDDSLAAIQAAREAIKVLESVPNGVGYQTKTEILSIHPSLDQWEVQKPVADLRRQHNAEGWYEEQRAVGMRASDVGALDSGHGQGPIDASRPRISDS